MSAWQTSFFLLLSNVGEGCFRRGKSLHLTIFCISACEAPPAVPFEDYPSLGPRRLRFPCLRTYGAAADGTLCANTKNSYAFTKNARLFLLELVLKVRILLQFQNFGCKTFRFRRVTFLVALLNLHVFRSKFWNFATKETFKTSSKRVSKKLYKNAQCNRFSERNSFFACLTLRTPACR